MERKGKRMYVREFIFWGKGGRMFTYHECPHGCCCSLIWGLMLSGWLEAPFYTGQHWPHSTRPITYEMRPLLLQFSPSYDISSQICFFAPPFTFTTCLCAEKSSITFTLEPLEKPFFLPLPLLFFPSSSSSTSNFFFFSLLPHLSIMHSPSNSTLDIKKQSLIHHFFLF